MKYELLKTFTYDKKYCNYPITIAILYAYDDFPDIGNFDFGSEIENKQYLDDFRSGKYVSCRLKVIAYCRDLSVSIEGVDYLGQCHVTSTTMEDDLISLANDHDMPEQAFDELKKTLDPIREKMINSGRF